MVTMVGLQKDILEAVRELMELDYDAIEAYEAAINRLEDEDYKENFRGFRQDHKDHVERLTAYLSVHHEESPDTGSMKQVLTQGKVVMAGLVGDTAILRAMLSNEEDTNKAYERMSNREDLNQALKDILSKGWEDEKKHFQWIKNEIQT